MKEKGKNFIVGILAEDKKVTEALVKKFEGKEHITMIDLVGMDVELAKKFINSSRVDVVVASEEAFVDSENKEKLDELIKADQEHKSTTFLATYNDENAEQMLEIYNTLSKNELVIFPNKLEDDFDYIILAENTDGVIGRKIQNMLREKQTISEIVDSFKNSNKDRDEI